MYYTLMICTLYRSTLFIRPKSREYVNIILYVVYCSRCISYTYITCWGHAVVHLIEALYYKSEDRGLDS